jgi:hypothetical protein
MQIDIQSSLKGIPPGAVDIAVAVAARGNLLALSQQTPASNELKAVLDECAKRLSDFIAANTVPKK